MRIRRFSQLDLVDKYLIISIVGVFLIVPAIFQFQQPATHFISMDIWAGLLVSTAISVFLVTSCRTRAINDLSPQASMVFSTSSLFVLLAIAAVFQLASLFEAISSFDASAIRRDIWYADSREEAIRGRGIIQLLKSIVGPLSLMLLADLFHSSRKRHPFSFGFLFLVAAPNLGVIALSSVHRSPLVFELAFWLFFWHFFIQRIKLTTFRFVATSLLVFTYLSWAAYFRAGQAGQIDLLHGMSGLATARQIQILKEGVESGALGYEHGLQFFYNLISWVPRQFWESKPITSFSFRLSEVLYGDVGVSTWVRTFTVPGEGYLQFGLIGMVLACMIFVYLYRITKLICAKHPFSIPAFLAIWVQFPLLLRGDLSAFFGRFWMALIAVGIFIFISKALRPGRPREHATALPTRR